MLTLTAKSLWQESRDAIDWNRKRLGAIDKMLEAYQTPWHRGETGGDLIFDSRNHGFEFIARTIAQTVFDNPRWQVSARRGYAAQIDAPALQSALNRWTREQKLKKKLVQCYVDFCFSHTFGAMEFSQNKQEDEERWRPKFCRIGPKRGFRDPRAYDREECRFEGHVYVKDINDLEAPEWNAQVVKAMTVDSAVEEVRGGGWGGERGQSRNEVVLIDIYVPEAEIEDSWFEENDIPEDERKFYHGMIYTIPYVGYSNDGTDGEFAKPPTPHYGPRSGPYQFGGCYSMPDDVMPLSNLVAVEGQNRQNNSVAKALYDAIVEYKRLVFASGKSPTLSALVKRAKHGSVVNTPLQDLSKMLQQIELGGPTPALVAAGQMMQEQMDRSSGLTEADRGVVTGATAYESSIAAAGASSRMAYPKQQFTDFTGEIGYSAAWYMHRSEQVVIDMDGGAGTFMGGNPMAHAEKIMPDLLARGIPERQALEFLQFAEHKWKTTPFESFDFSVEPMSTERASDPANRARLGAVIPMTLQLAQAGLAMPGVLNVNELLGWLGQAFDIPDLPRVYNAAQANEQGQKMLEAQTNPEGAQGTGQPRLEGDVQPVGGGGPKGGAGGGYTSGRASQQGTRASPQGMPKPGSKGGKKVAPVKVTA